MSKCIECCHYDLSYQYNRIEEEMFFDYEKNDEGKYIISLDDLHTIIDDYITMSMCQDNVKALVEEFGFFKALKLYQDNFGELRIDDELDFNRTFGTLTYIILDTYIREEDLIVEV